MSEFLKKSLKIWRKLGVLALGLLVSIALI